MRLPVNDVVFNTCNMDIKEWLIENHLDHNWLTDLIFEIDGKKYITISDKNGVLIDSQFQLILSDIELDQISSHGCDRYAFKFGKRWWYDEIKDTLDFNELKYLGKSTKQGLEVYLGVHGGYEICNGSRRYEDWCKKAVFLGTKYLGICEQNTLAGTLQFQLTCKKYGIVPIIGETVTVKRENFYYQVKLFCKDELGWNNLLWINKAVNVDNEKFVDEEFLASRLTGLIVVLENGVTIDNLHDTIFRHKDLYYQIDTVIWKSNEKDKDYLQKIKYYYDNTLAFITPMLVSDSYYLDKGDFVIKEILNKIGKVGFNYQSEDQFFKDKELIYERLSSLFFLPKLDKFISEIERSMSVFKDISFEIETGNFYLPEYELSEEEKKQFKNNEELFWHLIDKGLKEKVIDKGKDIDVYIQQVEKEYDVISSGNLVSYFLILYDIISWSKINDIQVGYGRGSVGGSLIAMLLGITEVDPLEYGLIFERFLTKERIKKSLPDIDTDFQSSRRDEVKRYIEQRYGIDNVCSIGSYGTFKLKVSFKDICRLIGINQGTATYMSALIEDGPNLGKKYLELFKAAVEKKQLKEFLQEKPEDFENIFLMLNQPRNGSVHAAGVIITPKFKNGKQMTIYDWFPVKKIDGVLVSEWEGTQLEQAGFLKEDILGITELDKFKEIIELIKKDTGEEINFNDVSFNDPEVFAFFKKGFTQDIFQFGAKGLTKYITEVQPTSIQELGIVSALYRPGAMDSNMHKDYVSIKFGRKEPEYNWGTRDILKDTFGLMIFQENTMKVFQTLGDFSLAESDDIRGAIGKKNIQKMNLYKDKFLENLVKKGCPKHQALDIWIKIERTSGYQFNKAHAITYSILGYIGQWLKVYFPMQFWSICLKYAKDDEISSRISEINKIGIMSIKPPDINISKRDFFIEKETQSLYWSIEKIKHVGEVVVSEILNEREKNGHFYSLSEFLSRVDKRKINKRSVINLILSGSFDSIEKIEKINDRFKLIKNYLLKIRDEESLYKFTSTDQLWWFLQQVEVSGSGIFDYSLLLNKLSFDNPHAYYKQLDQISHESSLDKDCIVIGILKEVIERTGKKGNFANVILNHNNDNIYCTIWSESWENCKDVVLNSIDKVLAINGVVRFDRFKSCNVVHSHENTKPQVLC